MSYQNYGDNQGGYGQYNPYQQGQGGQQGYGGSRAMAVIMISKMWNRDRVDMK